MSDHTLSDWVFLLGDDSDAWKKNADESAFRPVHVPHDWAVEADFDQSASSGTGYLPGGVGWYRSHTSIASLGVPADGHLRVVFHGAYKNADVWVNGYHLGGRPNGWSTFSFDLTEILGYAPDDDLVTAVRIERHDLADSRWYNGTGLTRRVDLQVRGPVAVAENGSMLVTTRADETLATVELSQTVVNHTDEPRQVVITHILEHEGKAVATREHRLSLVGRESARLHSGERVEHPALWSDEHPHLYRWVSVISSSDGVELSRESEVVGLRTFVFDPDQGFSINGQPRTLKGVCLHEDAGPLGVAVPREVWHRRLEILREAGCNAIRMAHNPHSPELYDLCDELGFFVIDEAFDEWESPKNKWWQGHNVYPPKLQGYAKDYPAWHEADLAAMVETNKLHPSIIAWSIGNEIDYPNDPYASPLFNEMTGNNDANKPAAERVYDPNRPDTRRLTTLAGELIDIVKAHDTSRPVTLAAAFPELSSRTGLLDRLDLIGYNYKEHLYPDDHGRFPDQPLMGSENGHGWAEWKAVTDNEFISGQFLWTGIDYLGETHGWPSHGSGAGLMTTAGFPKERYHLRRSWWADELVVRIATRPVAEGQVDPDSEWRRPFGRDWQGSGEVEVAVFSNAPDVALACGDTGVALAFDDARGYWRGRAVPANGVLRAVARRGSDEASDELAGSGPAEALRVVEWTPRVELGSPTTVHQLECTLTDAQGNPVLDDDRVVAVTVEGGALLGIDNGDLADTTAYRESHRRTLDGQAIVFVRGSGEVTLTAEGLPPVMVTVGR